MLEVDTGDQKGRRKKLAALKKEVGGLDDMVVDKRQLLGIVQQSWSNTDPGDHEASMRSDLL